MKDPGVLIVFVIFLLAAAITDTQAQSAGDQSSATGALDIKARSASISETARAAVAAGEVVDYDKISSRAAASAVPGEISLDSDIPLPTKRVYYTTIELVKISWPEMMSQHGDNFGSKLIIGLNKPYYRLKKDMRVIGSFDLKMDNIFFGLVNSAKITLKYDLKKPHHQGKSQVKFLVDGITFKVGIPFTIASR
jgi:hypothetical protein